MRASSAFYFSLCSDANIEASAFVNASSPHKIPLHTSAKGVRLPPRILWSRIFLSGAREGIFSRARLAMRDCAVELRNSRYLRPTDLVAPLLRRTKVLIPSKTYIPQNLDLQSRTCEMVPAKGFEPPTPGSEDQCSNPLSYTGIY